MLRFNHLQPPFDNPAIRRALLGAVDQSDYMQAVAGTDGNLWKGDAGFFALASPLANKAGMAALEGKRDMARVKADLQASGYKGERAVVMVATDLPALEALGQVGADMLKRAGINVEVQATDWGSVIQRRASKAPVDKGGWSVFFTSFFGLDQFTPATHLGLRGNGEAGWFGWARSPAAGSVARPVVPGARSRGPEGHRGEDPGAGVHRRALPAAGRVLPAHGDPQDSVGRAERPAAVLERQEGRLRRPAPRHDPSHGRRMAVARPSEGRRSSVVERALSWPGVR